MITGRILRIGRIIPAKAVKSSRENRSISKQTSNKNVADIVLKELAVMNKRS